MPIFDRQFYTVTTSENVELHTPLAVNIQAESPLGRRLIYSIANGDLYEEFAVDFNTGITIILSTLLWKSIFRIYEVS